MVDEKLVLGNSLEVIGDLTPCCPTGMIPDMGIDIFVLVFSNKDGILLR